MADIVKANGVEWSSVVKVDGATATDIVKVDGNSAAPPVGHWVAVLEQGNVAWAANTALSGNANWTEYDNTDSTGHPRAFDIAYGKNASGNGIYVCSRDSSSRELQVSGEDVTATHDWTPINITGGQDQFSVRWAVSSSASSQGVWMTAGMHGGELWRSIDGAQTFSQVVAPSLSSENIMALVSDGAGNWAFGNDNKFYFSDNDGASFTSSTPWAGGGVPGFHRGTVYTNNSWVVIYSRSSNIYARSCAASDITDWGTEFRPTITYNNATADGSGTPNKTKYPRNPTADNQRAAAEGVNGVVCMVMTNDDGVFKFSVSGKTITNASASHGVGGKWFAGDSSYTGVIRFATANSFEDITTDGTGTWVTANRGGDAFMSTDNGVTWEIMVESFEGGSDDWQGITAPVIFPL